MIATASPAASTTQHVATDSPDWRKLLRKITNDDGEWTAWAYRPEWTLAFRRSIKGDVGEPDREILVSTDCRIWCAADSRFGIQRPFSDAAEITIPTPSRLYLSRSDCVTACHLLLDGARLEIRPSSGSTSSSRHGLSFVALMAKLKYGPYCSVEISATTYINGERVISGPID